MRGLSGIGKTALTEQFVEHARASSAIVLKGRCYEREAVPFKALDAIVDALSRHLRQRGDVGAARLTPRDLPSLCQIFPVLARVPAFADGLRDRTLPADPQEVRRRAFDALKELLARLADEKPLVVIIDDLQWGDIDSGRALLRLLSPSMLLVASYRSDEVDRSPLLKMLHGEVAWTTNADTKIELEPLVTDDAQTLATMLLGPSANEDRVRLIAREARGNPFFITELSRAESDTETVSLAVLIERRVRRLGEDAQRLLAIVAVAGGPLRRRVLRTASALDAVDPVTRTVAAERLTATGMLLGTPN